MIPLDKTVFVILIALLYLSPLEAKKTDPALKQDPDSSLLRFGGFLQMQGVFSQDRSIDPIMDNNKRWSSQLQIWRARIMLGGNISPKTSFFMQTEIPSPIGFVDTEKHIQDISPIILDANIEHKFSDNFMVITGMQLVGINRQGLQSPVTLMGLDFGWYQYPYNLFQSQALQNNFGRDIGINTRGFVLDERLEWRLGVFRGRTTGTNSSFRYVFRLNYNFFEKDKGLYYTGTNLGKQKLFSIGGGIDTQDNYISGALDAFLDLPTNNGAFTWQGSYMYLDGGASESLSSFTPFIPNQSIFFTELGYFFKKVKIQPYIKYEAQMIDISKKQYTVNQERLNPSSPLSSLSDTPSDNNLHYFNTLTSQSRVGTGINYFVNDYNFHIKLQYEQIFYGRFGTSDEPETKSSGELKLQLTYFIFK